MLSAERHAARRPASTVPAWDLARARAPEPETPAAALQQALGNQALAQRATGCPAFSACPTGGACHPCPFRVQAKLTVNRPGDVYEQEADRVADAVMRMPGPGAVGATAVSPPLIQRKCAECKDEERVQTAPASGQTPDLTPAVQRQIDALRGGGRPLDPAARAFFEPRLGRDLGAVRVHTGASAAASAQALRARAYTLGRDVVFAPGEYAPAAPEGRRLLAHELAHVVQQSRGPGTPAVQRRDVGMDDEMHRPQIERARESMGLPPDGGRPVGGEPAGPSEAEIKYAGPGGGAAKPKLPACMPVLKDPDWDVASGPILMTFKGSKCDFQLGKRLAPATSKFGLDGMEFKGKLEVPRGCPGRVYYVQYTTPNRALVVCSDSKPLAECVRPGWGRDGPWPYAFGDVTDTAKTAGTTVNTGARDSPGQKNISNPGLGLVRICIANEEFVTYVVFEDASGGLTSLGWMNWKWSARLIRDTGKCPPKSTVADCTGWAISGKGEKINQAFKPGAVGPQPLDKSVKPVSMLSSSCSEGDCPATVPAAAPPGATPSSPPATEGPK